MAVTRHGKTDTFRVVAAGEGEGLAAEGQRILNSVCHRHGYCGVVVIEVLFLADSLDEGVHQCRIALIRMNYNLFHYFYTILLRLQRYDYFLNYLHLPIFLIIPERISLVRVHKALSNISVI